MFIVSGILHIDAPDFADARRMAITFARATRGETGCISCQICEDVAVPGRMYIYEEWDNEDVWDQHLYTPHTTEFLDQLVRFTIVEQNIKRLDGGIVTRVF